MDLPGISNSVLENQTSFKKLAIYPSRIALPVNWKGREQKDL